MRTEVERELANSFRGEDVPDDGVTAGPPKITYEVQEVPAFGRYRGVHTTWEAIRWEEYPGTDETEGQPDCRMVRLGRHWSRSRAVAAVREDAAVLGVAGTVVVHRAEGDPSEVDLVTGREV